MAKIKISSELEKSLLDLADTYNIYPEKIVQAIYDFTQEDYTFGEFVRDYAEDYCIDGGEDEEYDESKSIQHKVMNILEGADVRQTISEWEVKYGSGEEDVVDIDPFKNDGKPHTKEAGPDSSLKLIGDTTNLSYVKVGGRKYTNYNNIICAPGDKIYFFNAKHSSSVYYTTVDGSMKNRSPYGSDVGAYFTVPEDASGKATLDVNFGDKSWSDRQQEFKMDFHSPKTTGWVKSDQCYPKMLKKNSRIS